MPPVARKKYNGITNKRVREDRGPESTVESAFAIGSQSFGKQLGRAEVE